MELNKNNVKRIMLLIAFGVGLYIALKNLYLLPGLLDTLTGILGPVVAGFAMAFVLNVLLVQVESRLFAPLNRRCKKIWPKLRRMVSIFLTLLIVLGLISLVLLIILPELGHTVTNLANNIPPFFNKTQDDLTKLSKKHPEITGYFKNVNIDWASVSQMLAGALQTYASTLLNSTVTATTNLFHGAISLVLTFVISINALAQKETLNRQAKRVLYAFVPVRFADPIYRVCHLTNRAFYNFIAGTCTEACILGTLCFIGMNIFHFPYALLISVFVACMALIPILGSFLSTVIGALLILIVSPILALWYIVFFVILQQLEGNLIYPRVVGYRVGLPALWVLVAVTIGGNAAGILGMIINVPICSVLYVLLRETVKNRLGSADPDEPEPIEKTPGPSVKKSRR